MSLITVADLRDRCHVDPLTGCWVWTGALSTDGTPRIYTIDYARGEKRAMSGPLAAWQIIHGFAPLPDHLVYRSCMNRRCLCPRHLHVASSKAAIGAHIRRLGIRRGATDARLASIRKAQAASGVVLTPPDVVAAIRAVPAGQMTNVEIGAMYGVTPSVVSRIRLGKAHRVTATANPTPSASTS